MSDQNAQQPPYQPGQPSYGQGQYGQGQHNQSQSGGPSYQPSYQPPYQPGPGGTGVQGSLSQPLYGASFGQAITRFFKKYARFKGYASRSEYWWVFLAQFIIYGVLYGILTGVFANLVANSENMQTTTTGTSASFEAEGGAAVALMLVSLLLLVVALALLIPTLAISWRRLHDAGFAGPMYFLSFIPLVGGIILILLLAMPTNEQKRSPLWEDPARD